jgi:DNA-directed RNA polymerase specialized sigma24 family protein
VRVRNAADAEDILQDVLFEFVQAYRLPDSIEQISGWLFRVARNRIIDRFRKKKASSLTEAVIESIQVAGSWHASRLHPERRGLPREGDHAG